MPQIGEGRATIEPVKVDDNGKEHIKIRFDIFNDGTMNNRANIDARLVTQFNKEQKENAGKAEKDKKSYLTDEERKAAQDLNNKMSDADRQKAAKAYNNYGAPPPSVSDNSYEGYYTNIVRMERNVDAAPGGDYTYKFKTYVDGVAPRITALTTSSAMLWVPPTNYSDGARAYSTRWKKAFKRSWTRSQRESKIRRSSSTKSPWACTASVAVQPWRAG